MYTNHCAPSTASVLVIEYGYVYAPPPEFEGTVDEG